VASARLNIVLHQPEIPQNTGNIGRTCVAVGAKLWIVRPAGFRLDDRNLRRSGLDYWQYLQWEDVPRSELLEGCWSSERTFFLTKRAARRYTDVVYRPGDFLVFGSETRGLPDSLIEAHAERCLSIPMNEHVRSLNLSNAVAVVAYEAVRQFGALAAVTPTAQDRNPLRNPDRK
jgi:tRNA (cytidine/uridine-2'-O-)-methyltransferase